MMQAIAKSATFFKRISAVFLDLTRPASSIAKPGAMNMTRAPMTRK
jgi:hypothetical protein